MNQAIRPAPRTQDTRTLPAQALRAARECRHETRNGEGECTAMVGCADGALPLVCDCADCRLADMTKPEVNPYRRWDFTTVTPALIPGQTGVSACTRCRRDDCWTVATYYGRVYGFSDHVTAVHVGTKGGRVSTVHMYPYCNQSDRGRIVRAFGRVTPVQITPQ